MRLLTNNESIIKESHKRSEGYGVKKNSELYKRLGDKRELDKVLDFNKELLEVSLQYINMLQCALKDEDFIMILTDNNGCILYINGEEKLLKDFSKKNLIVGAYMDEESIGTNAMGTAIKEDKPIQITAKEHYIEAFHGLTCSAAPIHNHKGDIIGTLNLTGRSEKKHPHTLGLVIFGVRAIENEMDKWQINDILEETYNYMESVMDNVSKGIMIADSQGNIKNINKLGQQIFDREKEDLINKNVSILVAEWNNILKEFENGHDSYRKEIKILHCSNYKTILNFKPVRHKDKIVGMVLLMECEKDIEIVENLNTGAFYHFQDIIGTSAIMQNIITNCKIISNSPSTVLIEGESGTGKEMIAQSIHNYSYRRSNNFIAINCGAISSNLIESELFGYEEGTFTGGKRGGKIGKFEMASGGTLFLDEIGEMPLDMQVKLLRVLQEGRVTRLGGYKEIPIDVRIIAATNKNLKKEIEKGNFREDLYYRLCVIPIRIPPLRERKGDIEELINYFLRIKSFKLNKNIPPMAEETLETLLNYNWSGNIRELENHIESYVNLDGNISLNLLSENKGNYKKHISNCEKNDYICSLEDMEKDIIIKTLNKFEKNMSKAAKSLGISRNTLYLKIKKYNIEV